ncbi:hypothetical protein O0L34_g2941 [Tuta absoluta]|nr:hypothetical protein O0L34_g2941 [Tuta absoluta]
MTTSSEDVLLSVGHVRYKKGDGTLYVMNQRLAWMLENRDTVAVSHKYADIKTQKISPAGKSKVQLQVVLHDGTCSTFHFVNPAGAESQAKDRDQVKSLLQNLLPKFKRQIDGELEMKSKLLSLHPTLKHLYEDLVITKVINSEEYWNTPTLKTYTDSNNMKQEAGVSGAFLADIQPQTDGCNGLKYNLTQDIIDAIFKTYPAVRKKHVDYVPNKMTESEFWTKFFQSHYFHRDRIASSSSKDLFGECAKMDDHAIASAMKHTTLDLTVDLPQFTEKVPLISNEDEPPHEKDRGDNISIHRNMIKRFNQHSIMVLKASHKTNSSNNSSNSSSSKTTNNNKLVENGIKETNNGKIEKRPTNEKSGNEPPEKKRRILEKIHYEDLEDSNRTESAQELKLSKIERYLLGPSSQITHANTQTANPPPLSALASICQAWSSGQQCQRPVRVSAASAVAALGELSPGGALMRQHHAASMAQLIPADVKAELHRIYLSGGELLRELWRCFPQPGAAAADTDTVARADKFYEALLRFRNVKLRPFEEKMLRDLTPLATSLTKHMNQMIDTACSKYVVWQQRQAKLR